MSGFRDDRKKRNFDRRDSGRPDFGNRPRQMFPATCDQCHKQCEVPFRPTGDKPVYCKDCFHGKRDASSYDFSQRGPSSRDFPRRDSSSAPMGNADKRIDDLKRQLDGMNLKLDTILKLVQKDNTVPAPIAIPSKKPSPAAKKTEKKAVLKKKPAKKKK